MRIYHTAMRMLRIKRRTNVYLILITSGLVLLLLSLNHLRSTEITLQQRTVQRNILQSERHLVTSECLSVETASIQTNLSRLLVILKDPNERQTCAWIRMRVTRMWPKWVKSIYSLSGKQDMSNRKRRQILLYLGFLSKKANWGFAETQFKGGFLGELVVWSDLIATLYILGHNITVTTEFEELEQYLDVLKMNSSRPGTKSDCETPDSIIYTDICGLMQMTKYISIPFEKYKCRLRVLDSFGTEPAFNHKLFARRTRHVSDWGGWNLRTQQFYNMFPHTPDDTFLGFVVQTNLTNNEPVVKEDIALVYGKGEDIWMGKETVLKQFKDAGFSVHGTVNLPKTKSSSSHIPDFVTNHGVMYGGGFPNLLRRSKIFIGMGKPYEGPAALEAIAHGAVFINPKLKPPINYMQKGKPTERIVATQNPYIEQFIGEPYAYNVDITKSSEVDEAIKKIIHNNKFVPFLPYEYSEEGYIQRINSYVEHQDFCRYKQQNWPSESSVKFVLGNDGVSCKDTCWQNNLVCEPSHFYRANTTEAFKAQSIECKELKTLSDIHPPSVKTNTDECTFQSDELLFSCVGGVKEYRRLCPCRTYIKYQSGLCKGCET